MASDALMSTAAEIRENLVTTAVKFLSNPSIQRYTIESKERFLRSKGLTEPEIQRALEKCMEAIDVPSMTKELMFFQQTRPSWFRDNVLPVLVYGGFAYGCYWFYKNYIRQLLFVEQPKRKTTADCIDELRKSLDILNANVTSLRGEMQANAHTSSLRSQLDNIKSDLSSVKGILLNRNQFPAPKARLDPPSIPAWQRQSEEAKSTEVASEDKKKGHRSRSQRSESGGSNSSEGEQATKNSDSSLEIIKKDARPQSNSENAVINFITKIRGKGEMMDKPRRPMSAYMLWLNHTKEQIKAENPGMKITEIAKKGVEIWRSMDKSEWYAKAAAAKEQYEKDLDVYNACCGEQVHETHTSNNC